MDKILISIKPEWVCKILNGEKTIEVRKTAPKCELPVDVYIYCTEPNAKETLSLFTKKAREYLGRVVEFIDRKRVDKPNMRWSICNGKVVAKFTLKTIGSLSQDSLVRMEGGNGDYILKDACLSLGEIKDYAKGKDVYLWHISDLEIFDEPMELDGFEYPNPSGTRYVSNRSLNGLPSKKHPPQSWCYVEEKE